MVTLLLAIHMLAPLPSQAAPAQGTFYVVKKNDILGYVSLLNYGTSRRWKKIARWNNLSNPNMIRPGMRLILQEPPSIAPAEGARLVATERAKHSRTRHVAVLPVEPKSESRPKVAEQKAYDLYKQGNLRAASPLLKATRNKDPTRVTAWLYELSALKLSGQREEFARVRAEFLGRFPHLKDLALLALPSRGTASTLGK